MRQKHDGRFVLRELEALGYRPELIEGIVEDEAVVEAEAENGKGHDLGNAQAMPTQKVEPRWLKS